MNKYTFLLFFVLLLFVLPVNAQVTNRFAIVITELFPDPSPSIGLPNSEFIELKNISTDSITIRYWKISDGNNTAVIITNFILQPDSFVIICPSATASLFAVFGATIGVSGFPSLNNDADNITLYTPEGQVIHSISYTDAWYQNDLKKEGGWTLEMIDTQNPCGGASNFRASIYDKGGTPGTKNSIAGINKDEQFPALLRTYTIDSVTIVAVFDESLDSTHAANSNSYLLNNSIGSIQSAIPVSPLFTEVQLRLNNSLVAGAVYQLTVTNVSDCAGNTIGIMNAAKAGLPITADTMDMVINEFLFNPKADGYDYIEFYNRSRNIIDCKQLYIANRSTTGSITNSKQLVANSFLCFPQEYMVITENKKWLLQNYTVKATSQVIEMNGLPSLPDDKGNFVLMNFQGKTIDELTYEQNWHFPLIDNKEGIALERMNYNEPTQQKTNWTSATSTSGFGTPSYQNSQFRADLQIQAQISIYPKIFSPDNDGVDDFATVRCQLTEPGYVVTISIFDVAGRMVKMLAANATLSATGVFRWDGLNDQQQKLPTGMYIILTEIFNLQGKTKKFKNVVTLGRKS